MSVPESLRILHITPYYDPAWAYGGSTRVVVELARRQAARGHAVTVATTDALDESTRAPAGAYTLEGVTVHRFGNLSNTLAWRRIFLPSGFARGVAWLIRRVDVVHIHEVRSLLNAAALPHLLLARVPYVITAHGGLPAELGRAACKRVYDALYGRRLLEHACRLHAMTTMERDQYAALGLPPERIVQIPNGIDPSSVSVEADARAFRQRHNIPDTAPVVGFLGRLNRIKGLDFLVDAFAALLRLRPDAVLLIAGPDDGARGELEAQIARLGIGAAVRFTGMISDDAAKTAAYCASDVYVLPSRYENLPTTVLEALLVARPCIVTDRCGLAAELVEAGVAQTVPFGDTGALQAAILRVLDDPPAARAQAEAGRRYVIQHFDWQTAVDRWLEVYRECVHEAMIGPLER